MVTVADADSLDLTKAMTLEAWVKPSALGSMWRTVVVKEQQAQLAYALYAGNGSRMGKPSGHVYTTGDKDVAGSSLLPTGRWSHLASTWDGRTLVLYVNGRKIASAPLRQTAVASDKPLRFGGNTVWNEWFKGAIDEIRIYDRALTPSEIQEDEGAPSSGAATQRGANTKVTSKPKEKAKAKHHKKTKHHKKATHHKKAKRKKHTSKHARPHARGWMVV
jgi:hypothetical protein